MEGVMMKNGNKYACAVRKPDGEIIVDVQEAHAIIDKCKIFKWPIIRGAITFIDSMIIGVKTLTFSANFFEDEEDTKKKAKKAEENADKAEGPKEKTAKEKREEGLFIFGTVALSIVLAVGIFMILPYFLSMLLKKVIESPALLALCEGLIRILLFIGYVAAISCMKDIRRVFMYHGAEHKSINCVEQGYELNVANVRKCSREHKRCGTSFLLIVMVISVVFFVFIRAESTWLMILIRLLLIPVIAGISYEFIRLAGRTENKFITFLSKPGLALQNFTTREPDDDMIECAIASVEAVFDWRKFQEEAAQEEEDEKLANESPLDRKRREKLEDKKKLDELTNPAAEKKTEYENPADDPDFDLDAAIAAAVNKKREARLAEMERARKEAEELAAAVSSVENEAAEASEKAAEAKKEASADKLKEAADAVAKKAQSEEKPAEAKKESSDKHANNHHGKHNKGADRADARKQVLEKRVEEAAKNAEIKAEKTAEAAKKAEEQKAEAAKKAEEQKAEAAKKAEEQTAEAAKKAEEQTAEAAKKAEEQKKEAVKKAEEQTAEAAKKAEEQKKEAEEKADKVKGTVIEKTKANNTGRAVASEKKSAEAEDDTDTDPMNSFFKRPEHKENASGKKPEMSGLYTSTNRSNVYVQTVDHLNIVDDADEDDDVLNALDRYFVGKKPEEKKAAAEKDNSSKQQNNDKKSKKKGKK